MEGVKVMEQPVMAAKATELMVALAVASAGASIHGGQRSGVATYLRGSIGMTGRSGCFAAAPQAEPVGTGGAVENQTVGTVTAPPQIEQAPMQVVLPGKCRSGKVNGRAMSCAWLNPASVKSCWSSRTRP